MHTYNPVFQRLAVDHIVAGGSRVYWELNRHFIDPGSYSFQLQTSHTGLTSADDWSNVGSPVIDTYLMTDNSKRLWGKTQDTHYRVRLTTGVGTYYSEPQECSGHLSKRDWLVAREITRKEYLRHRVLTSANGYLLKVRRYGPKCTNCTDRLTGEISIASCPICYGTGFEFGYFTPLKSSFVDIGMESNRDHRDGSSGTIQQNVIQGRFIGDPQIYSYDIWVNETSDERYYLHTIKVTAQIRGVAVVYDVEMRLAPYTDIIYTVPVDHSNIGTFEIGQNKLCPPQKQQDLSSLAAIKADAKPARRKRIRLLKP